MYNRKYIWGFHIFIQVCDYRHKSNMLWNLLIYAYSLSPSSIVSVSVSKLEITISRTATSRHEARHFILGSLHWFMLWVCCVRRTEASGIVSICLGKSRWKKLQKVNRKTIICLQHLRERRVDFLAGQSLL